MTLYNKRLQKYYDNIIEKAVRHGYDRSELLMPFLDELSHQTKSARIMRMISLAYYLGMMRGVAYIDEMQTPIILDACPATDNTGKWIITDGDSGDYEYSTSSWIDVRCSNCNFETGFEEGEYGWSAQDEGNKIPFAYCPNCGAKMCDKDKGDV